MKLKREEQQTKKTELLLGHGKYRGSEPRAAPVAFGYGLRSIKRGMVDATIPFWLLLLTFAVWT